MASSTSLSFIPFPQANEFISINFSEYSNIFFLAKRNVYVRFSHTAEVRAVACNAAIDH